jgi:starch synthase
MNICFVSSEVAPFAKTGGLADVSGALPRYISRHGNDIRIFMPMYSSIDYSKGEFHSVDYLRDLRLDFGGETISFSVVTTQLPESDVDVYMIHCPRLYHRGSIYTDDNDEYLRFAFLSRAAIECCQRMGWAPDIFHCNDWQSSLIPLYLRTVYNWDRLFWHSKTVLTIHNIAYQGGFPANVLDHIGLGGDRDKLAREDLDAGIVNYLKTGIIHCDLITTVSNTYAHEIQTAEYGHGLQDYLRRRSDSLIGIVNGVDYQEWGPEQDKLIPANYSINDLSGKETCKRVLMEKMELPYDPYAPVLGVVSRLTGQKGFDLFFEIIVPLLHTYNLRLVILGSGEDKYESFFQNIHDRFRDKVCFYRGFQNQLAHMIEAGSDIFLMPSRFEPCGLNQIYSLKYGTIPVVRKTGGLNDTVRQFNPATGEGTGFVFEHYTSQGLLWGIQSALQTWMDRRAWGILMHNAMSVNFSWETQVTYYLQAYRALLGHR